MSQHQTLSTLLAETAIGWGNEVDRMQGEARAKLAEREFVSTFPEYVRSKNEEAAALMRKAAEIQARIDGAPDNLVLVEGNSEHEFAMAHPELYHKAAGEKRLKLIKPIDDAKALTPDLRKDLAAQWHGKVTTRQGAVVRG